MGQLAAQKTIIENKELLFELSLFASADSLISDVVDHCPKSKLIAALPPSDLLTSLRLCFLGFFGAGSVDDAKVNGCYVYCAAGVAISKAKPPPKLF